MIEKHYVYKVSVMSLAVTQKPYNSLVKITFRKVTIYIPHTLIKHIVYEGFQRNFSKNIVNSLEIHHVYKVSVT